MKVQVEIEFAPESVATLIVNAVETHNALGERWLNSFDPTNLLRPEGVTWWQQLPRALKEKYHWSILFEDVEGDKHVLNQKKVERGLELFVRTAPSHYRDWQAENDDAFTGDVFLQLCLFGDIVY
jgi:hypothetical protein